MATVFTDAQMQTAGMTEQYLDPTRKPGRNMWFMVKRTINFDQLATLTGQAVAVNDTYPLAHLRKGDIVIAGGVNVITAATAAVVFDIGGTDVDGVIDGVTGNAVTAEATKTGRGALLPWYIVTTSGETVRLKAITNSPAGGEVEAWLLVFRGGAKANT